MACNRISWRNMLVTGCLVILLMAAMVPVRAADPPLPAEVAQLKDENPLTRVEAANALARSGDPRVVTHLLPLLEDEFTFVRTAAVYALAELGDPKAIDPLLALLQKPELELGSQAIDALSKFRDPRVTKVLLAAVKDKKAVTRAAAVTALGNHRDASAFKAIFGRLMDEDAHVRAAAVTALGKLPADPKTVPTILALLNTETDGKVQVAAARTLGRLRAAVAIPKLLDIAAMEQNRPEGNRLMVTTVRMAITNMGEPAIPVLLEKMALPDYFNEMERGNMETNRRMKWLVVDILQSPAFQLPKVRTALLEQLKQGGESNYNLSNILTQVRSWKLAGSLEGVYAEYSEPIAFYPNRPMREYWCKDPVVLSILRARFLQQKGSGSVWAAEALRRYGDASVVNDALPLLDSTVANERLSGAGLLISFGNKRAYETLLALTGEKDIWTSSQAAKYLADTADLPDIKPIQELLKSTDANQRSRMAGIFGQTGDGRYTPALIALLQDEDGKVREYSALALGMLGDQRAVDPLIAAMKVEPEWSRSAAAWALGQIGDPRAADALAALLPTAEERFQVRAARALLQLRDPRGLPPLVRLLDSKDDMTRSITLHAISNLDRKEPGFVEPLLKKYQEMKDLQLRGSLLMALAPHGTAPAVSTLVKALDEFEDNPTVRAKIVRGLGVAGDKRAVATLLGVAQDDPDGVTRTQAALALQALGDAHAMDLLLEQATDQCCAGRNSALAALAGVNDPRVTDACAALLQDDDPITRTLAARALAQKKDPRGMAALLAALTKETEGFTLLAAIRSLGEAKDPQAVPPLLKMLAKAPPAQRAAIATALSALGDRNAVEPLKARLKDNYPHVRAAAVAALKVLAGQDYSKEAEKW